MDYEKKYKEALERAKKFYANAQEAGNYNEVARLENMFPELRESEDERIRKIIRLALIASEDELSDFYKAHNIRRKECTDWLEKQKEQKPEDKLNHPLYLEGFDVGREVGRVEAEQKPAEWSEEDENMRNNTILSLQSLIDEGINDEFMKGVKDEIAWLKSLRNRPKKSDSWKPSEEDEV